MNQQSQKQTFFNLKKGQETGINVEKEFIEIFEFLDEQILF